MIKKFQILQGSLVRYLPSQNEDLIADSIIGPVKGFDRYGFLKFNDLGDEKEVDEKYCFGVPLTEDYLRAFEIEELKNEAKEFRLLNRYYLKPIGNKWFCYLAANFEFLDIIEFEFVHELQLFYIGLTKKELKYNPNNNQRPF